MSKKLLVASMLLSTLLLTGCTMPWSNSDSTTDDSVLSGSQSQMTTASPEECKKAVEQYLADSKKATIDTTKKVGSGNSIVVDYVGRLADGTVFDTSVESVAKSCGVYSAGRDYAAGLPFTVGAGKMIAGFDKAVVTMSLKETKTINIAAVDAYGPETITIGRDQLPSKQDGTEYKAGDMLMTMNGAVKIESINDKEFTIKNNHPLAGKDLIFDITIKSIN